MSLKIVEEIREKAKERVETLRKRFLGESGGILRAGSLCSCPLGSGAIVDTVLKTIEQRPKIIPTILEKVKAFEPGKRVKEVLQQTPAPATTPVTPIVREEKKILRG